jgi:hypothetical protein
MRIVLRRVTMLTVCAIVAALASSVVPGTRIEVQDWDCPLPPASCARPVEAVGFPLPYIADYHGISPVGSADLMGMLMGIDKFRMRPFLADVAFYSALIGVIWLVAARRRRAVD